MIISCSDCIWNDVCSDSCNDYGCDDGCPVTDDFKDEEYLCEAQIWINNEMQYFDDYKGEIEDE